MRYFLRAATLTGYPELARSCGLDPARLLAGVGLREADLAAGDRWIPAAPVARLLELSAEQSGREDFGLRLAGFRRLSTLGPLSLVIREEPDLRSALQVLGTYQHVYNGAMQLRLDELEEPARIMMWLEFGEPAPVRQGLDLTVAALMGIIRELVSSDWEPLSAHFSHPAPADPEPYRRAFGPRLRFTSNYTGLDLRAGDLDSPIGRSDPTMRPYTRQFLSTIATPAPAATDQVGELVEVLLPLGRCSMAQVSRTLGIEPRTLHRKLAEQQDSFSSIVRGTRTRLAERYLAEDRYSLTDVSHLLGFGAPSAFSRWFRRQFMTTPSGWRSASHSAIAAPCPC